MHVARPGLDSLFETLDRWRHFPAYRLENRVDAFFGMYLPGLVQKATGDALADVVVPEFPIRRSLVEPETTHHLSYKVDFCLFSERFDRVYFVELKTDLGSRRDRQDEVLRSAQSLGFGPVLEGLCGIFGRSQAATKYLHLARTLAERGFVDLPNELRRGEPTTRGLKKKLGALRPLRRDTEIELVYVLPEHHSYPDALVLDFDAVATHVAAFDDPFSQLFARYLVRWKRRPPGQAG